MEQGKGLVVLRIIQSIIFHHGDTGNTEFFRKILSEQTPLVSESNPNLPVELDRILSKALGKDADVSYQSALDLRADLKRVRREIDSSPSLRSASETRINTNEKPRANYLPFAAGALAVIIIGLGIWFFFKQSDQKKSDAAVEWGQARHAQLTDSSEAKSYPSLSPDGKDFIYTSQNGDNSDIFQQRIGGKSKRETKSSSIQKATRFSRAGHLTANESPLLRTEAENTRFG